MKADVNQKELADLFGVTTRQIRNWEADGLPKSADGNQKLYPLRKVIAWHEERAVAQALAAVEVGAFEAAKIRKLEAEAESKELDLAVRRGELVPLDEVEGVVRESLQAVDSVLRHSPSRFAPLLAKAANLSMKKARAILRDMIELVRGAIRDDVSGDETDAA